MQENQIVAQQPAPTIVTQPATPATVLMYAMEKGADMTQIEKLMDLQLKWEANEAKKAYVSAMAEFKRNPPTIIKDKTVAFSGTSYTHASLGNVTNAIVDGLAQHGFSHCWDVSQDGMIKVTCRITHRMGHSEEVTLAAMKDDSGKKNAIQQVASAITYLQRYTLLAATGLATHDQQDDDGQAFGDGGVTLAEKWCGKAVTAKTIDGLAAVWASGSEEIAEAKDAEAYGQFKVVCNKRKAELEAQKNPVKSSRIAGIVGEADEDAKDGE